MGITSICASYRRILRSILLFRLYYYSNVKHGPINLCGYGNSILIQKPDTLYHQQCYKVCKSREAFLGPTFFKEVRERFITCLFMRSPHLIGPLTEEEGVSHEPSKSLVSEPPEQSHYPIQNY